MGSSRVTVQAGGALSPGGLTGTGTLSVGSALVRGALRIEYDGFTTDSLTVTGVTGGDFNSDGMVDAADYVFWRRNDNTPANYTVWRNNFDTATGLNIKNATLNLVNIGSELQPGNYVIAQYNTLIGPSFAQVNGLPAGFTINYAFGGNQIALVSLPGAGALGEGVAAVPEPSVLLLTLAAFGCACLCRRRWGASLE
jgi:hypothetical protein